MSAFSNLTEVELRISDLFPVFEYYNLMQAICVPSGCSAAEIRTLSGDILEQFEMFKLIGDANCQTKESISYAQRFAKLSPPQLAAALFVSAMAALVLFATGCHWLCRSPIPLLVDLSAATSSAKLLDKSKPNQANYVTIVELNKLVLMIASIGGHSMTCLESIPAWNVLSKLRTHSATEFTNPVAKSSSLGRRH